MSVTFNMFVREDDNFTARLLGSDTNCPVLVLETKTDGNDVNLFTWDINALRAIHSTIGAYLDTLPVSVE